MMQIDELIFYNREGDTRPIELRAGKLNVITGDNRTGKSSLINIVRFLLGAKRPHTPRGPIRDSVLWYALRAHVGQTRFFIAREAPSGDDSTSEAMLIIGDVTAPPLEELKANTSRQALRDYLGGLLGIEDNRNVPNLGQTRHALSASFVHSLIYCFQGQGEIANPDILFHRQNREWMRQTIRDTLPYFLGAQGAEDLRRREELAERRRELRRLNQRLRAAESERSAGLDRAGALIAESVDVGLLPEPLALSDLAEARGALADVLSQRAAVIRPVENGGEFDRLRSRRAELAAEVRDIGEQIRALEQFADADNSHAGELSEQHARLASIGLIPEEVDAAHCALCEQPLGELGSSARAALERAVGRSERRLDLARQDTPRIEKARAELFDRQRRARDEIRDADQALNALADQDELVRSREEEINLQSYVRGRIAQYLETSAEVGDRELDELRKDVAAKTKTVDELAESLDVDAVRSRTTSLLRNISRQMTTWAVQLGLEHAEDGVQIDLDRLTIVADTPGAPAYMDRGEIGSGMNWVGYHLTSYLALQRFFIEQQRPVPSFLVLDQPSQAFFPRDRETGGDLDELTDTDRENTRRLYELTFQIVQQLGGRLQVIALDHADFEDEWFAESVVQRWRGGEALIPRTWLTSGNPGSE
ncbi:MAG: DUF3732 domain-containing protein [Actinobacteria bacterium]|nr:DUF3732 domain-containing protein [Actinomycetota bacterium]